MKCEWREIKSISQINYKIIPWKTKALDSTINKTLQVSLLAKAMCNLEAER